MHTTWLGRLAIFALVLIVLKVFFAWRISIIGSLALAIVLSLVFSVIDRSTNDRARDTDD